jgi:amidase
LQEVGRSYFSGAFERYQVHAVLSVNNKHASYAAVAQYPALTLPMGYRDSGEPVNLTLIGKRFQEWEIVQIGRAFEKLGNVRKWPDAFDPGN